MSANPHLDLRRQSELFDADSFDTPVTVIGAGATASWLVTILARLGIQNITVYDFDVIEEHNIPNQAYGVKQIGMSKVEALCHNVYNDTKLSVNGKPTAFTNQRLSGYVFNMIDTMDGRRAIWDESIKMKSAVKLLVEPRMGLEVGRVYNVIPTNLNHIKRYEDCFYSDAEAEVSACGTSMTVVTTAMAIASECARSLIYHHQGHELNNELLIDYKFNGIYPTKW